MTNNILKIKSHEKKRLSILKSVNNESLFTRSPLANLIILACCGTDAVTIYTVLNYSLSENVQSSMISYRKLKK